MFWYKLIEFLNRTTEKPKLFGWFHLTFLFIFIALGVLLVFIARKKNHKAYLITLSISYVLLVVGEIFKQFVYCFSIGEEAVIYDGYFFGVFPFFPCSAIFYLIPFLLFVRNKQVKYSVESFLIWTSLIGGLIGFIYPAYLMDPGVSYLYICCHTLIHHGLMIVVSLFLIVYRRKEINFKYFMSSFFTLMGFVVVAEILNATIPHINENAYKNFNGFDISWIIPPNLPIVKDIWANVPYPIYLILFIIGFLLMMFIIYVLYSLILLHKVDVNIREIKFIDNIYKKHSKNKKI